MVEYCRLTSPDSQRLLATDTAENPFEVTPCPITHGMDQHRSVRRVHDLRLEVKHGKRDETMIFSCLEGPVVHERLLAEFERRGFSGYRLRPATVGFRDGYVSRDYAELIVTGWAGVARPESGIRLIETCPACDHRRYSALADVDQLIDWDQWTGDDFFIVWPLPKYTLITARVAAALKELRARSYNLESMQVVQQFQQQFQLGFTVGSLSQFVPCDVAERYAALV